MDDEAQRAAAKGFFNRVWHLLELPQLTRAQTDELVHSAHASCAHWLAVGDAGDHARGEWQCSRVYVTLGRAEPALHHARRCLEVCEGAPGELEEFDLPFAHEALARAFSLAGDLAAARDHHQRASELAAEIADDEDRELVEADLETIPL